MSEENELLEKLSDLEHKQWSHWTSYMLDNLTDDNIQRWKEQIKTSYNRLSEKEKESDREWARKVLEILNNKHVKKSMDNSFRKIFTRPEDFKNWLIENNLTTRLDGQTGNIFLSGNQGVADSVGIWTKQKVYPNITEITVGVFQPEGILKEYKTPNNDDIKEIKSQLMKLSAPNAVDALNPPEGEEGAPDDLGGGLGDLGGDLGGGMGGGGLGDSPLGEGGLGEAPEPALSNEYFENNVIENNPDLEEQINKNDDELDYAHFT